LRFFGLKLARNLYWIVTALVVCGLFTWGLTEQQWTWPRLTADSGTEEGLCFAGFVQGIPVVPVCYTVGAVGVICLGWYWLKPTRRIASIAGRPKEDKASCSASHHIAELEKQVKDLQIQVQLSQRRGKDIEAIIYSIRDAVIVIDEFDRLLMANEAAGRLFDFDFKSSQHKPIRELIGPDQSKFEDILSRSRQSKGRATRQEIKIADSGQRIADSKELNAKHHTLNAEERTFNCVVSCIYDQSQRVCGTVAVLHDITREREISQMKNDFVGHVSHELKTPLATITAYSEMLCDSEAQDGQTRKEFCSVIREQAKRLSRLIEDVLNISRIESGLIKVSKEPASLTMLIEEQMQMMKSYAEEKNIKIIGQKPIVFDQVYVDKDMIRQVIVNLLSNAVKYTPYGGSVKIETEVDEIAGVARVSITDTGVGIPENEIERVFDKFYRVDVNKNQAEGTGLGLSLVKQIVEKVHDGRVFVTSRVGVGSTFSFELPLATREAAQAV
jgi:two-component system phosphate regulon sensor histidine kinase PhoR